MKFRLGLVVSGWMLIVGMTAILFSWPVAGMIVGLLLVGSGLFIEGVDE